MADAVKRDAMTHALDLLRELSGDTKARPAGQTVRREIGDLISAGDYESLVEHDVNLKDLVISTFDWAPGTGHRATNPVVKAVGSALAATRDGRSRYANGVEAVSYAAACTTLLEPDRIAALIARCSNAESGYAAIRYTVTLSAKLNRFLGHYPAKRRELLLGDLWDLAHDGRWWNYTATLDPSKRRRKDHREAIEAWRTQFEEQSFGTTKLVKGFAEGTISWTPAIADKVRQTKFSETQLATITRACKTSRDPDVRVMASLITDLGIADRPENPIPAILVILERTLGDEDPSTVLPAKPNSFEELFPEASMEPYEIPSELEALNGQPVTGIADSVLVVIHNDHELRGNADHMGNCSFGWAQNMQSGSSFIVLIKYQGESYNTEFAHLSDGSWRLGQTEGRVLAGRTDVPQELTNALAELTATLNA